MHNTTRRIFLMLLALVMSIGLLAGCQSNESDESDNATPPEETVSASDNEDTTSSGTLDELEDIGDAIMEIVESDDPQFRPGYFTDAQLEYIETNIGTTTENEQIVLYQDPGPMEDEYDYMLNRYQTIKVFKWEGETLTCTGYLFGRDEDGYDAAKHASPTLPREEKEYVDEYYLVIENQNSYLTLDMIEDEPDIILGDWQSLYDFFQNDSYYSLDFVII